MRRGHDSHDDGGVQTETNGTSSENADSDVAAVARELVGGAGWRNPSEQARTEGLSRREFLKESGLASLAAAGVGATAGGAGGRRPPAARNG